MPGITAGVCDRAESWNGADERRRGSRRARPETDPEVIRGRGLTDVLVVVTRYFGGTLLGTGGLVRAYTQAALEGLSHAGILRKVPGIRLRIGTDYTGLGKIQYLLAQRGIDILDTVYTDRVEILTAAAGDTVESLKKEITEGTSGQAVMEEDGQCWLEITEKPPA